MKYIKTIEQESEENRILRKLESLYAELHTNPSSMRIRKEINLLEHMFNIVSEKGSCTIEDLLNAGFKLK